LTTFIKFIKRLDRCGASSPKEVICRVAILSYLKRALSQIPWA
jgi:hypothetical protein